MTEVLNEIKVKRARVSMNNINIIIMSSVIACRKIYGFVFINPYPRPKNIESKKIVNNIF